MSRLRLYQIAVVAGFVMLLKRFVLPASSTRSRCRRLISSSVDFVRMLLAGRYFGEIGKSLAERTGGICLGLCGRRVVGTILHGYKTARDILDPLFATHTMPSRFLRFIRCSSSSSALAMGRRS